MGQVSELEYAHTGSGARLGGLFHHQTGWLYVVVHPLQYGRRRVEVWRGGGLFACLTPSPSLCFSPFRFPPIPTLGIVYSFRFIPSFSSHRRNSGILDAAPAAITGNEVHQATFIAQQTALPTASAASLASVSARSTLSSASLASLATASIVSVGTGSAYSSIVSASIASMSAMSVASFSEASFLSTAAASASASRKAAANGSLQGNGGGNGFPKWAVSQTSLGVASALRGGCGEERRGPFRGR